MVSDYRETLRRIPQKEQAKYAKGIAIMDATAQTLHNQGLLPERFSISVEAHELQRVAPAPTEQTSQNLLKQLIAEYKRGVRTPEMWTAYWRAKLVPGAEGIGIHVEVTGCDWTEKQIEKPMVDIQGNEIPGLMVPVISGITLPVLGSMYPKMQNYTVREDSPITDTHNTAGWIKVYAAVDAPNRNTGKTDAETFANEHGYLPGREITYILGGQASKDLQGKYPDQGSTWSWLGGSRLGGEFVRACFDSFGSLYAVWGLYPGVPGRGGGWRFEEVKPKA